MRYLARRLLSAVAIFLALIPLPGFAQSAATGERGAALSTLLDALPWNATQRGVLFAVASASVYPVAGEGAPERTAVADPLQNLEQGVARYGREIVRLGDFCVVAPRTMVVTPSKLPPPDLLTGLGDTEKRIIFAGMLLPDQWRKATAPAGIGAGDLDQDQLPVFLSLIPNPLRIRSVGTPVSARPENTRELTAEQRLRVRLRLNLDAFQKMGLVNAATPNYAEPVQDRSLRGNRLERVPERVLPASEDPTAARRAQVRIVTKNGLKPGQLDLGAGAFDREVSLSGCPSVGDVIRRVGQVSGVPLRAAPALAALPVWMRGGDRVRARDILQGLCLAVTATFRRVGPDREGRSFYLLTDDIEGIGQRQARLTEWQQAAQRTGDALLEISRISTSDRRRFNPVPILQFAPDDPFALKPADVARWVEVASEGRTDVATIPTASLLPDAQVVVRARSDDLVAKHTVVNAGTVQVSLALALYFLVPGVGEAVDLHPSVLSAQGLLPGSTPPLLPSSGTTVSVSNASGSAAVALPAVPARALCVQPRNKEEALQVVSAARERGLDQVWLVLPDDGGGDLLTAAIDAGKAARVSVWAVLRLLSRSPRDPSGADSPLADVNVLGETSAAYSARRRVAYRRGPGEGLQTAGDTWVQDAIDATYGTPRDWLRTDEPRAEEQIIARATEIARTPGLSGLVLTDTAAPGYAARLPLGEGRDLGYSVDARVAFIAQGGGDPIDLFDPERYELLDLPFFPTGDTFGAAGASPSSVPGGNTPEKSPREAWKDLRAGQNVSLMARVYEAIHQAGASLPLLMRDRGDDPLNSTGWFGSWDSATSLPDSSRLENGQYSASAAHTQCQRVLLSLCWQNRSVRSAPKTVAEYAALLQSLDESGTARQDWDGIVLDFGALPVTRMMALLKAFPAASKTR